MSAESLAGSCDGAAEAIVPAHGFTINQIVELVRAGLASATAERVVASGGTIEVARVRITEAGGGPFPWDRLLTAGGRE
jgi:hypothetical protein